MKRYLINSLHNMRDLGGYLAGDGKYTNFSMIIRSDRPTQFTENDLKKIKGLNITQVIDLRTEMECQTKPSAYADLPEIKYHICSFNIGGSTPKDEEEIPYGYLSMFEDFETIKEVLTHIADNQEGATVFHCAIGKDRTGIIAALILKLCDIAKEDIIADYQISHTYLKSFLDTFHKQYPELPKWMGQSKREYMENAMELLLDKYGNFNNYLDKLEIENEKLLLIRNKLLS